MIARLGELLRYSLEEATEREIPLEQELVFIDRYLEIMRIRFQGSLEVAMSIDPDTLHALVPNLVLQPLVENAVKHGVSNLETAGRIEIAARRAGERLVMTVRDNGPGVVVSELPLGKGVGLRNTRERLAQLYGSAQYLILRDAEGGGVIAELSIPYQTAADLRTAGVSPA
jgi:sensor histidine kinase YesM